VGKGHDLDYGDARRRQFRQFAQRRRPCSLRRECAEVHFVDHLSRQTQTTPVLVGPGERGWIDNLRGTVRSFRLKTRDGIGVEFGLTFQLKAIARSGRRGNEAGEIAVLFRVQGKDLFGGSFQNHRNGSPAWCPDAKMTASVRLYFGTHRQPSLAYAVHVPVVRKSNAATAPFAAWRFA